MARTEVPSPHERLRRVIPAYLRGGFVVADRPGLPPPRIAMIDADPVASCVREVMAQRKTWIGTAAELLSLGIGCSGDRLSWHSWPKNPRALAGRLRRAQTQLRSLGIEIVSHEW